ncbi:MAG TPA: hypothetical protein VFF04_01705 [Candidatus Babeliales bacterium]|nr:hypothetical protein [Candidatus Babeliales bacterium]
MNNIRLLIFTLFVLPSSLKSASAAPAKAPAKTTASQLQITKPAAAPLPLPASSATQTALLSMPASAALAQTQPKLQSNTSSEQALASLITPAAISPAGKTDGSSAALSDLVTASELSHVSSSAATVGVMISSPMPAQIPQMQNLELGTASVPPLRTQANARRRSLSDARRAVATEFLPLPPAVPKSGSHSRANGKSDDKKTAQPDESKEKKDRDSSDAPSTVQKEDSGEFLAKGSPVQSESLLWSAFNIVGSGLGILERQTRKIVQSDSSHLLHLNATGQLKTLPKADQIALVARALQANATKMKSTDGTAFQSRVRKQIAVVDATTHKIDSDVAGEAIAACELFTKDLNTLIAKLKEKSSGKA